LQYLPHLVNYFNPQLQKHVSPDRSKSNKQYSKYTKKKVKDYFHDLSKHAEGDWWFLQVKWMS